MQRIYRLPRWLRFAIFGTLTTGVNLATVAALTAWFGVWFKAASFSGEVLSNTLNFFLQKSITFENRGWERTHRQTGLYVFLKCCNCVNVPGLGSLFLERVHLPVVAQVCAIGIISVQNYVFYRWLIFR